MQVSDRIDGELRARARPERAEKEKAYLKSAIEHYGCDAAALKAAVKSVGKLEHAPLIAAVRALWKRPVFERRAAAALLLERHVKLLDAGDLPLVEQILHESRTWAIVDLVAVHVAGPIADGKTLDRWADARRDRLLHPQGDRL